MLIFINIFVAYNTKTVNMNVKLNILTAAAAFFVGAELISAQTNKADSMKTKNIDEVVVVAFGKQKKETVVGSNTTIKSEAFTDRPITNISQAIDGAAPGVQISTATGQPGSSLNIRIRGIGSYTTSSAPLYVVDGVIYSGSLSSINPDDIESLNILKDAASTSLYGSGAANGVILITTKSGKKGRDYFTLKTTTGVVSRSVSEYPRLGTSEYYPLVWESIRNGYLTANPAKTLSDANTYASNNLIPVLKTNIYDVADNKLVVDGVLNPDAKLKYTDLDWVSPVIRTGFRQNYDVSYGGGGEKTKYFSSLSYNKEEGYIIKSDFERVTAFLKTDSQLKKWLKVGLSLNGSTSKSNNAVDGANNNSSYINPYYWTRIMGPIYSPYAHDPVTFATLYDANGEKMFDAGSMRGSGAAAGRNVIQETLLNNNLDKLTQLISRGYAEFKLDPYLTVTTNVGYDIRNYNNSTYGNKIIGDAAPAGSASRTATTIKVLNFNQLINYVRGFNGHNFDFLLGHESTKYNYTYMYGYKTGQVAANNDELINFTTIGSLDGFSRDYRKEGYFTRLNYDYNQTYLLSASYRYDGSSRFYKDNRWGSFWSLGAGWRINKTFFPESRTINELKLRASYGETGNDSGLDNSSLSFYAYQGLFNLGYNNASEPGILYGTPQVNNLTWESNNQFDLALDYAFFNRRITGAIEYYKRNVDGLIFSVPAPVSAGIPGSTILQNLGAMYNEGIEFSLNAGIVRSENFGWDLSFNAATLKNRFTKLPDGQTEIISGSKKIMVGHSIYDFWLRQWYGVDAKDGSPLFLASDAAVTSNGSDIRTAEDGTKLTTLYTNAKYDYSGTSIPDLYGSLTNDFRYKNITLSTLFTYQIGGKTYDTNYAGLMTGYAQGSALHADILNRWTTPGQVTNVPRMDSQTYTSADAGSTRWLVKSDYIAFRQATLTYSFDRDMIQQYGMNDLKFSFSAENIWAKTARKGLEPVQTFGGTTSNRYTPSRIFSFGLNVGF